MRNRPIYEHIPYDMATDCSVVTQDVKSAGIGCSKYYESYGKRGQTGGLMVAWCQHLVCLGFHFIPKGKGRNDVFSALYCYWEVAPKIVIYDFACALGPYCMAREPRFFAKTRFLIDGFHAQGHTRCSKACSLPFYKKHDNLLADLNSSAAECGNSGIGRISKSLSYMTQRHAIIYTRVFLSVWNRERRRAMRKAMAFMDKIAAATAHDAAMKAVLLSPP